MSNTVSIADTALAGSVPAEKNVLTREQMAVLAVGPVDSQALISQSSLWPARTIRNASALNTLALVLIVACIFTGVLMPGWAMSYKKLFGNNGMASAKILQSTYRLKMSRIHTAWVLAKMIQIQSRRNWTLAMLIVQAVCVLTLQAFAAVTTHVKHAIAATERTCPFEATIGTLNCLGKKAFEFKSGHRSIVP